MKLKKAVGLCMQTGNLTLFNHTDEDGVLTQWLSDGRACYPLLGMPHLDEETVCTVFDIPEKKQEKMMITIEDWPTSLRVDDYTSEDKMVEKMAISINCDGYTLLPMFTRGGGITFIQGKYLGPVEDTRDNLTYCERVDAKGKRYIAVFNGLLIAAIIYPYDMIREDFAKTTASIAQLVAEELREKSALEQIQKPQGDEDQRTLFEGEEREDEEEGEEPGEDEDDTDRS